MLSTRPITLIDGPLHPKTPGRAILKSRGALQENAIHYGERTTNTKGNFTSTPRHPTTLQSQKIHSAVKPMVMVSRPLLDKTPFPNRQANIPLFTPAPQTSKLAKLSLLDAGAPTCTPGALLRPSSARKSLRAPHSASKNFETPVTAGNHWDVSEGDIDVGSDQQGVEDIDVSEIPDYDDIEYMPPTAVECPYEPDFDMPNYKIVGKSLLELASSHAIDDSAEAQYDQDITVGFVLELSPELLLPELEDDPFRLNLVKSTAAPRTGSVSRPVPASRPGSTRLTTRALAASTVNVVSSTKAIRLVTAATSTSKSTPPSRAPSLRKTTGATTNSSTRIDRPAITTSRPRARTESNDIDRPPTNTMHRTVLSTSGTAETANSPVVSRMTRSRTRVPATLAASRTTSHKDVEKSSAVASTTIPVAYPRGRLGITPAQTFDEDQLLLDVVVSDDEDFVFSI